MTTTFTDALLKLLQPMMYDGSNDLPVYLSSQASIFELVEEYASDGDNGEIGYSLLVDGNRVPDEAVPWLAQFVGVRLTTGLSVADQRSQLLGLGNLKRGTIAALQAAPVPYLTGSQSVVVHERDTSAYHFEVVTLGSETPDSDLVLAALLTQKPAGLVMSYVVNVGQKAFLMRDSILRGTTPDSLRLVI